MVVIWLLLIRFCRDVYLVGVVLVPGRKRFRLIRKTPAHLAGYVTHSRPKVWKRLCHVGFHFRSLILITRGGDVSRIVMVVTFLLRKEQGLG